VTAEGALLWLDVEPDALDASSEVDDARLAVVPCDDAVVAVVVAPVEPVAAMTPKARTKVARVAAAMRRRIVLIRAARACKRCRTVSDVLGVGFEGMRAR